MGKKQMLARALFLALMMGILPGAAFAAGVRPACENHLEHDDLCGYVEGSSCGHTEHTADCCTDTLTCMETEQAATESEASSPHEHSPECYELDCPHERGIHDDTCGYEEHQPCGHMCAVCSPKDSGVQPDISEQDLLKATGSNISSRDASMPEIEFLSVMTRNTVKSLANGKTLADIGAKTDDVITIESDFSGEIGIPADIKALTLKSNGALTDSYITSEGSVALTIDGLNITAPIGTEVTIWDNVTGSYPAINLAGDSTLTVKGSNHAAGGRESAGIRVSSGQSLTIGGDGDLTVSAGPNKAVNPAGGAAIGGNGCYLLNHQDGEVCGTVSIEDTVALTLQGSYNGSDLGCGGGMGEVIGIIAISGNPVISSSGGLYVRADKLIVDGGTLNMDMLIKASIVNSNGDPLNRVDIPAGDPGHLQVKKEGDPSYSYTAAAQDDGAAYIWLPSGGSYEIYVDRGDHIDVYLVGNLGSFEKDVDEKITSNVTFAQPDASYSSQLQVLSAALLPTGRNSGTVTVTFNQEPDDSTGGSVSVSRDGFATESVLTLESESGSVCTYSYAGLHEGTYTIRVKGFRDSSGYENQVFQSVVFTVSASAATDTSHLADRSSGDSDSSAPSYYRRAMTDRATGVKVEGNAIHDYAVLTVNAWGLHSPGDAGCDLLRAADKAGLVLSLCDVSLSHVFLGKVTVSIPVEGRDGQTLTAAHCVGGQLTLSNVTVKQGYADMAVETLSPFAVLDKIYTLDTLSAPAAGNPFTDVKESDWFYDAVLYACQNGLMNGTADSTFAPFETVTRAQIPVSLYRLEGSPAVTAPNPFADVRPGQWYTPGIIWAADAGLVDGHNAAAYGPNDPVTREQAAVILWRYAKYKGWDVGQRDSLSTCSDAGEVSEWAREAMEWALGAGLLNDSGGQLFPKAGTTRAEYAQMLRNLLEKYTPPADNSRRCRVQKGDTLFGLARKYNSTVVAIVQANPVITNPSFILPGWELDIP